MVKKILITGGCGFIGANLVPVFINNGYEVIVYDNLSTGNEKYLEKYDVKIIKGDINNKELINESMSKVDYCIHLAAYGGVIDSIKNPFDNFEQNVKGTLNILEACKTNNIKKLIFSSTGGAIMGNTPPPVNEETLPKPISPYGAGKACCEAYCSAFSNSYDLPIVILRFANIYGPFSGHKQGAVTKFINSVLNDKDITIYGNGSATRDFLYVEDLCEGIVKALTMDTGLINIYHLAFGKEISIKELAKEIITIENNNSSNIKYLSSRKGEVEKTFADYNKAKNQLEFNPKYSLNEGLKKTIKWFKENKNKW